MNRSVLKQLIKECIAEMTHKPPPSFETLSSVLTFLEEFLIDNKIILDSSEHPHDEADPTGIRGPFMYGGMKYTETKTHLYKVSSINGKPTKKGLYVSIYRYDSGRYELTYYVS